MIDGKIYRVICNETNEVYYGSTIQPIKKRMYQHTRPNKTNCRQIINRGNYRYEVCEEFTCDDKKFLLDRERYWIENNDCINKIIPNRTYKEFYQDNRQKILNEKKQHYIKNRQRILDYKKQYYLIKKARQENTNNANNIELN